MAAIRALGVRALGLKCMLDSPEAQSCGRVLSCALRKAEIARKRRAQSYLSRQILQEKYACMAHG